MAFDALRIGAGVAHTAISGVRLVNKHDEPKKRKRSPADSLACRVRFLNATYTDTAQNRTLIPNWISRGVTFTFSELICPNDGEFTVVLGFPNTG